MGPQIVDFFRRLGGGHMGASQTLYEIREHNAEARAKGFGHRFRGCEE